jgi:hypothetical protein
MNTLQLNIKRRITILEHVWYGDSRYLYWRRALWDKANARMHLLQFSAVRTIVAHICVKAHSVQPQLNTSGSLHSKSRKPYSSIAQP